MKFNKLVVLMGAVATLGTVSVAQAAPGSGQSKPVSGTPSVTVGVTEASAAPGHGGPAGLPGIGVSTVGGGAIVSFAGLSRLAPADAQGVHHIQMAGSGAPGPSGSGPDHSAMGVFNFAQVASDPVYFGEWSATGSATDPTRTVYYAGKDVTTTMPVAGTATYQVTGINQYSAANQLAGIFTADFDQQTLTGHIDNAAMQLVIDAGIDGSTFAGTADITGVTTGETSGHFFGDNAASLAGIAVFAADPSKDTAFGGAKQ